MPDLPARPPIAAEALSVVLVVTGDSRSVDRAVSSWSTLLGNLQRDYEMLLVAAADRPIPDSVRRQPGVRVLSAEPGFGSALRAAVAAARHPLLACSTADRHYLPADLHALLKEIDRVDLVSGYRASQPVPAGPRSLGRVVRFLARWLGGLPLEPLPGWLGWQTHGYAWLVRLVCGVRVRDVGSEFKLFRTELFRRLPIQSAGSAVHAEVLAKANFMGCLMAEVPITYRHGVPPRPAWRELWSDGRRWLGQPTFGPPEGVAPAR